MPSIFDQGIGYLPYLIRLLVTSKLRCFPLFSVFILPFKIRKLSKAHVNVSSINKLFILNKDRGIIFRTAGPRVQLSTGGAPDKDVIWYGTTCTGISRKSPDRRFCIKFTAPLGCWSAIKHTWGRAQINLISPKFNEGINQIYQKPFLFYSCVVYWFSPFPSNSLISLNINLYHNIVIVHIVKRSYPSLTHKF